MNDRPDWLDDFDQTDEQAFESPDLYHAAQDYFDGSAELPAIREPDESEWGDPEQEAIDIELDDEHAFDDSDELTADDIARNRILSGNYTDPVVKTLEQARDPKEIGQMLADVLERARQRGESVDPETGELFAMPPSDPETVSVVDLTTGDSEPIEKQPRSRVSYAVEAQEELRQRGKLVKRLFMEEGRDLWFFDRNRYWKELGYSSFDEWLADPENHQDTTRGHLAVQVFDCVCQFFQIDFLHEVHRHAFNAPFVVDLTLIGYRNYMIVMPTLNQIMQDSIAVGANVFAEWVRNRARVEEWLISAMTLSSRDLQSEAYDGNGWATYFSGILTPGTLRYLYDASGNVIRARTVDEIIDVLGLSDLPDNEQLNASIRGKEHSDDE